MEETVVPAAPARQRRGFRRAVTFAITAAVVGIPGFWLVRGVRQAQRAARSSQVT